LLSEIKEQNQKLPSQVGFFYQFRSLENNAATRKKYVLVLQSHWLTIDLKNCNLAMSVRRFSV